MSGQLNANEIAEIRDGLQSPNPTRRIQALAKFASTLPKDNGNAFIDALKDGDFAGNFVDMGVRVLLRFEELTQELAKMTALKEAAETENALLRAQLQEETAKMDEMLHIIIRYNVGKVMTEIVDSVADEVIRGN